MARSKNRIPKFCDELAKVWMSKDSLVDLRFSQIMLIFLQFLQKNNIDPFYYEEDKMMDLIKKCFKFMEENDERSN